VAGVQWGALRISAGQRRHGPGGARRSLWRALGGSPGLAWLLTGFFAVLDRQGVDAATRRRLLVDNPARVLSLSP